MKSVKHLLRENFLGGVAWSFGVTMGFVIISTILVVILSKLGGIPLIGGWIAKFVIATQQTLPGGRP